MAYSDVYRSPSQSSSSSVTAIDGVGIKINEKLVAPAKVMLPIDYEPGNPSEVLFLEYDFSLEERVLAWMESQMKTQQAMNQAETERVGDSIEMFSRPAGAEQTADPPPSTDEGQTTQNTWEGQDRGSTEQQAPKMAPKPTPFMNLGLDILTPVPIAPREKREDSTSSSSKPGVIDLTDFENEQDPFDNMELKVLNDREELNKMSLGVQASPTVQPHCETGQPPPLVANGTTNLEPQPPGGAMQRQTTGQPPPGGAVNLKDVDYPDIDSYDSGQFADKSQQQQQQQQQQQSVPTSQYQNNPLYVQSNTQQVYYQPQQISGNSMYGVQNSLKEPREVFSRGMPLPSIPSSRYLVEQPCAGTSSKNPAYIQTGSAMNAEKNDPGKTQEPVTFAPLSVSYAKHSSEKVYMPLNNPYSRHSCHATPNGIVVSSAEDGRVSSHDVEAPLLNPLRTVRSTPDISGSDERRIPAALPSSHTPPPGGKPSNLGGQERSRSPPPRPSSQQVELEPQTQDADWNHYKILPSTPRLNTPGSSPRSTSPKSDSRRGQSALPDPYNSLAPEAQRFVENIADMGFSRVRVSRAVEKHGKDDKEVLDYLCLVNRIADKGHDLDNAETALHLCDNKEDKAVQYLKLLARFKEIGFSENAIQPALLSTDLDENKTLDLLTTTS